MLLSDVDQSERSYVSEPRFGVGYPCQGYVINSSPLQPSPFKTAVLICHSVDIIV